MARELPLINRTMDRADLDEPGGPDGVRRLELDRGGPRRTRSASQQLVWPPGHARRDGRLGARQSWPCYEPLPDAVADDRFPWFLYWEIAWLVTNNRFRPGQRLLDLGGSSSLFSCYVASMGLEVVTVDLDEQLVANAGQLAAATGWNMHSLRMDMRALTSVSLAAALTTSRPHVCSSTCRGRGASR